MISTRHIRRNFYTWLDVETNKTSTAVCGVRTRNSLIGIPTVTNQDLVVIRNDRAVWGWCISCCYTAYQQISKLKLELITNQDVLLVYKKFLAVIERPAKSYANENKLPFTVKDYQRYKSGYKVTDKSIVDPYRSGLCYLCQASPATAADHIMPKFLGGSDNNSNLGPICNSCNGKKGTMSLEEVVANFPNLKFPDWFMNPLDVTT